MPDEEIKESPINKSLTKNFENEVCNENLNDKEKEMNELKDSQINNELESGTSYLDDKNVFANRRSPSECHDECLADINER